MCASVKVTAPSRLHFGLMSFGNSTGRQYGGVGVMIEEPHVDLAIVPADEFSASGPRHERVRDFAGLWAAHHDRTDLPACHLKVEQIPTSHVGLGSGTQIALAVAEGLNRFYERPIAEPAELAASAGRGMRSAIGTYGFRYGGLIVDGGKLPQEKLGQLKYRAEFPEQWRFVLVRPRDVVGCHGDAERQAFGALPPVPRNVRTALAAEIDLSMLPALERSDCDAFGESVYRYGVTAGTCFAPCQGGPFGNRQLEELVHQIRGRGVPGVGQSSWGPTLFVVTPLETDAQELVRWLNAVLDAEAWKISVTAANNSGATVSELVT